MTTPLRIDPPSDLATRVPDGEYARLLGYPDHRIPSGPVRQRADEARAWFVAHGSPWALARRIDLVAIGEGEVRLADGTRLESRRLASSLRQAAAPAVVLAAVSAGSAVDERADLLWSTERPDAAYFADRFGAALVEHLASWLAGELRRTFASERLAVLPSYSPGYDGWDLTQQTVVASAVRGHGADLPPGAFEVLSSGAMRPRISLLGLFGLTPRLELAARAWQEGKCRWCALPSCSFRRRPVAGSDAAT